MRLLLDTHVLLWAAGAPERLSAKALALLSDERNELIFSAVSLWEIAIKSSLGRPDFVVDSRELCAKLLQHGYTELPMRASHSFALAQLPPLHKDPFDRMLLAQALREDLTLVTADETLATYPGPIVNV